MRLLENRLCRGLCHMVLVVTLICAGCKPTETSAVRTVKSKCEAVGLIGKKVIVVGIAGWDEKMDTYIILDDEFRVSLPRMPRWDESTMNRPIRVSGILNFIGKGSGEMVAEAVPYYYLDDALVIGK